MQYIDKFNDTFKQFVNDLCVAFPNDGEFRMCKMLMNSVIATDTYKLHHLYHSKVALRYHDKIRDKDETFFLSKDYKIDDSKAPGAAQIIDKVKDCWQQMSNENKEIVWRYLKVLNALSAKVHEQRTTRT